MGFSYGYNRAEDLQDYRSAQELILMLADVVSRGGNLCLDVGPRADGKIPVIMQERLLQIGEWLRLNGEAIYGSRMWTTPCQWSDGLIPQLKRGEFMTKFNILEQTIAPPAGQARKEVLFTRRDSNLYAIAPLWPGRALRLKGVQPGERTVATLLATQETLAWHRDGDDLLITMPEYNPNAMANQHAYVFRLTDISRSE
jgi:alpha-L-fucosidase